MAAELQQPPDFAALVQALTLPPSNHTSITVAVGGARGFFVLGAAPNQVNLTIMQAHDGVNTAHNHWTVGVVGSNLRVVGRAVAVDFLECPGPAAFPTQQRMLQYLVAITVAFVRRRGLEPQQYIRLRNPNAPIGFPPPSFDDSRVVVPGVTCLRKHTRTIGGWECSEVPLLWSGAPTTADMRASDVHDAALRVLWPDTRPATASY